MPFQVLRQLPGSGTGTILQRITEPCWAECMGWCQRTLARIRAHDGAIEDSRLQLERCRLAFRTWGRLGVPDLPHMQEGAAKAVSSAVSQSDLGKGTTSSS